MNAFLAQSIEYAQQRSYLDDLFRIYPTIPNGIRDIDGTVWSRVEDAYHGKDNRELIRQLLRLELFPIKDSYVAFLKRDVNAIDRNPATVNRLCGELYAMGLDKMFEKSTQSVEKNRQIGPMFKNWLRTGSLGLVPVGVDEFIRNTDDAILDANDAAMKDFAEEHLRYNRNKGLDLIARFNGRYVIGEAKFLTDVGGHQNTQFEDAVLTLDAHVNAVKVAILDGICYSDRGGKMYRRLTKELSECNIMSALLLRNFLYTL